MGKLERHERFRDARTEYNRHGRQSMDIVAAATTLSKNMISRLESEEYHGDVGYKSVAVLAQHYGVSADWLLGLTEDPRPTRTAVDELGLTPDAVTWLREFRLNSEPESGTDYIPHDGLVQTVNQLFENAHFQDLVLKLCYLIEGIKAEEIYYSISKEVDLLNKSTSRETDLADKIQAIADSEKHSRAIVDLLHAQTTLNGDSVVAGLPIEHAFGINVTDILKNDVNRSVSRLVDSLQEGGKDDSGKHTRKKR